MMRLTPRGMGMGYNFLYYVFSQSFSGLEHLGFLSTFIVHFILQFWQRNRPGFAALFGILVALCFDGVSLYVFVISLIFMCTIFLLLSSQIKQISVQGGIQQLSLLCLQFCLILHVFICLRRTLETLLPSSASHWSYPSIQSI